MDSPRLTPLAITVLEKRYLKKNTQGVVVETPDEMFWRVARDMAEAERLYKEPSSIDELSETFHRLMASLDFLPNSPCLMNAGKELQQLAACFVLPIEDSLESIFETVKQTALIHQSGRGTGFSFSHLRPKADTVQSTGGVASGPISFMRVFNMATEVIRQGGTRRGANMGVLRVDHPDIMEFITIKQSQDEMSNFNLSVGVTKAFMEALTKDEEYDLINPRTKKEVRCIRAKAVFEVMVKTAWETGDPGVLFLDRINEANPTPHLGEMESTNPCGEVPLLSYEPCVLGSINLLHMPRKGSVKDLLITSFDIPALWHVKIQAGFQEFTDNAVSKTIHFSREAIQEEVKEAFWMAYREKCKGITIYRRGSKPSQVLACGTRQVC